MKKDMENRKLGRVGPKGFRSRTMGEFLKDLETGDAQHLMPVFNAKEKLARGEITIDDIPYMQRGGNWDMSDVKGAKVLRSTKKDLEYDGGSSKTTSIFGAKNLPWQGGSEANGKYDPKKWKDMPTGRSAR